MMRSSAWSTVWSTLRLLFGLLAGAAITRQLVHSLSIAQAEGRDIPMTVANFFSYFTILSNVLTVLVLVWAAVAFAVRRDEAVESPALARVLVATSTYMIITGIVYNTLLRGIPLAPGTSIPWTNEVLHVVGPLFLLFDLFCGPRRRALPWRSVWTIAAFPILWVVYTLVRGPLVTDPATGRPFWYPYPFLNPGNFDNGYGTVVLYIIGIAIAIIAVGFFSVWVGRRRGRVSAAA